MEEKMKREKNKNRASNEGGQSEASTTEAPPPIGDDDGQSHSIDTAEQLPSSPEEEDADNYLQEYDNREGYASNHKHDHEPMQAVIVQPESSEEDEDHELQEHISSSTSTLPNVEVESEKLEVIEIRSDGSTGHLTPGRHLN